MNPHETKSTITKKERNRSQTPVNQSMKQSFNSGIGIRDRSVTPMSIFNSNYAKVNQSVINNTNRNGTNSNDKSKNLKNLGEEVNRIKNVNQL